MLQNLRSYRSLIVSAANTSATRFATQPARLVVIKARAGNAGPIQILGVNGTTPDTDGVALAAGATLPTLWCDNLDQLAYKAANANDVLEILYGL